MTINRSCDMYMFNEQNLLISRLYWGPSCSQSSNTPWRVFDQSGVSSLCGSTHLYVGVSLQEKGYYYFSLDNDTFYKFWSRIHFVSTVWEHSSDILRTSHVWRRKNNMTLERLTCWYTGKLNSHLRWWFKNIAKGME